MPKIIVVGIFGFVLLFLGCSPVESPKYMPKFSQQPPMLKELCRIGVHPLHNPQRLHQVFGPLAEFLNDKIPSCQFVIEASRNYASYDEKLNSRAFEFALPNPFQTLNAMKRGYKVIAKMADDENFRGIILTRKDQNINQVSELKGSAVSYPAPTALAATMMPQLYLQQNGVDVETELDNRYVGSQESSIMNVFLGQTMAGATWPPPWRALSKERPELAEQLEVTWQTDPLINNSFMVRDDVSTEVAEQVAIVLSELHLSERGRTILTAMQLSQFDLATQEDYEVVKRFLNTYLKEVKKDVPEN